MTNISPAAAQSILNHWVSIIDAGAGVEVLEIYTADYTTLLVNYTLAATPFGAATLPAAGGHAIVTANALPIAGVGLATGVAGAFRQKNGDGLVVADGTGAGAVGTSDAIVVLESLSVAASQAVTLNDYKYTQPTALNAYAL